MEMNRCSIFIQKEMNSLKQARVWLSLGQIALNGLWPHLVEQRALSTPKPKFSHGGELALAGGETLLMSYHPSQQNTFTGRLTEPMFDAVFKRARELISS
jgi:uracil-DNA glycosylase